MTGRVIAWAILGLLLAGIGASYLLAGRLPPDCQPVGEDLRWQIEFQTASFVEEIYASPSRTEPDVWLVSSVTDHGVAVWTSSVPPDHDGPAIVSPANQAAITDSISGIENEDTSGVVPGTVARSDQEGIAAAEACVA